MFKALLSVYLHFQEHVLVFILKEFIIGATQTIVFLIKSKPIKIADINP